MSIWSSVGLNDESIVGLDSDDEDSHYKGLGEPKLYVGVATTWHDHARLSINDDHSVGAEVLLPPEELRRLAAYLWEAAESCEAIRSKLPDWEQQAERLKEFHRLEAEQNREYLDQMSQLRNSGEDDQKPEGRRTHSLAAVSECKTLR